MSDSPLPRNPFLGEAESDLPEEEPAAPQDPYAQARATKAQLQANTPLLHPSNITKTHKNNSNSNIKTEAALTPIFTTSSNEQATQEADWIKELRSTHPNDDQKSWSEIAQFLNYNRKDRAEAAHLTPQAVYAAYVRATSEAVAPANELGFAPGDYVHLRNAINKLKPGGKASIKTTGKEIGHNVREPMEDTSMLETVKGAEMLVDAVAMVERGFWGYVADEMERSTGKLYKAEDLAARFHKI